MKNNSMIKNFVIVMLVYIVGGSISGLSAHAMGMSSLESVLTGICSGVFLQVSLLFAVLLLEPEPKKKVMS